MSGCSVSSARPDEALQDELVLNEVQRLAPEPHYDRAYKLNSPESRRQAGSIRADDNPPVKKHTEKLLILTVFSTLYKFHDNPNKSARRGISSSRLRRSQIH